MRIVLGANPLQVQVLESIAQNIITVLIAGRQWGKTWVLQAAAICDAFKAPGRHILYCAHADKLCRQVYEEMVIAPGLRSLLHSRRPHAEQPYKWIRFRNNSLLSFFSLEQPDTARGQHPDLLLLDEGRQIPQRTWAAMIPTISAIRGHVLVATTPRGKENWCWKLYEQGLKKTADSMKSFFFPSPTAPHFQGPDGERALALMRSTMTEGQYRNEVLCEPISVGDPVFIARHIEQVIGGRLENGSAEPTLCAIDLGRSQDPTAFVIGTGKGQVIAFGKFPLKTEWERVFSEIGNLCKAYNAKCIVDSTGIGRDSLLSFIRTKLPHGVEDVCIRGTRVKEDLVQQLALKMELTQIGIPAECQEIIEQLNAYEYRLSRTGEYVSMSSPAGAHDDYVSAMMLYCEGLARKWLLPTFSSFNF